MFAARLVRKHKVISIVTIILTLLIILLTAAWILWIGKNKNTINTTTSTHNVNQQVTVINQPTAKNTTLLKTFEGGKLYKNNGIYLLVLSGTFHEMGRQYGALLGKEIEQLYQEIVIKPFVNKDVFSEDQIFQSGHNAFQNLPKRQKELLTGMSETSGIPLDKMVSASDPVGIMIMARLALAGNMNSCTSAAVWGQYTSDGKTLTARDYDFPDEFRQLAKTYATVVVYNPTDGSNSLAGVGFVGMTAFIDAMNDKGMYMEANNGADSAGLVIYANRTDAEIQNINVLFDADTPLQFENLLNNVRASYPAILLLADGKSARYFELATWDTKKTESVGNAISAANQFKNPSWGMMELSSPAAWYSTLRDSNLYNLVTAKKNQTPTDIMATLNVTLYNEKDWSLGKGAAVIKKNPHDSEITVWQTVTKPSELKLWLRLPTITDWILFDFAEWFKK